MFALAPRGALPPRPTSALHQVATAFLRRRPLVVAPLFAVLLATLVTVGGPPSRLAVLAVVGILALGFFGWEAWRARRRLVTNEGLAASLLVTLAVITLGSAATGGAHSPLLFMLFAPVVVGFAAFGRSFTSNVLLGAALAAIFALALLPAGVPFPPLPPEARRFLAVACAVDALLLLRLGVAALSDAHAISSAAAAGAGDELAAAAAARAASLEALGAKVAHEVRNPLSAIRGLVEVIAEGRADERDRKRLAVVLGEVNRIDEILRGYLAMARPLDELTRRPVDVGAIVREVAVLVEARAARAGIAVDADAPSLSAELDPRRMKEALLNLTLNALEATPPGGRVHLALAAQGDELVLTVADTGSGIAPARLATAGQAFDSGRPEGTGLGLALARQAVEQHGGQLTLESAPGQGTRAILRLPAQGAAS